METLNLIDSFSDFSKSKNIDRETMVELLEDVFKAMIRKKFGSDEDFAVIVNAETGDLQIMRTRQIVADDDENLANPKVVALSEARKTEADFEVGEELAELIPLSAFGRRVVLTARQTLMQRIRDLEKIKVFEKYTELEGEIIIGEVSQAYGREVILWDNENNELALPRSEQIPKDRFRKGDMVKVVVLKAEKTTSSIPRIIVSRAAPLFLERLFENEIPEIYDGLITIKNVVREPGERAKVAVESYDPRIDPVGACVGMKGSRIHGIVRELNNENIDVINYTENLELYVTRALSPAKITSIQLEENDRISVYLKPDQVSLAIGRGGHNIKLASKLVGHEIDVYSDVEEFEQEEDLDIQEFSNEIDEWVIEELKRVGLDSARSILSLSMEELLRRVDLEEETVEDIFEILKAEFDEE